MMDWAVKAFLKSSLAWLGAGVTLGVAMAVYPPLTVYRAAHLHMNLLGFVTMMIFGVALHVIPRFTGHPLHSRRFAVAQWWLANGGLTLMVGGLALLPNTSFGMPARIVVAVGGLLAAAAAYVFIYNLWRTIDGRPPQRGAAPVVATRSAPVPLRRMPAG